MSSVVKPMKFDYLSYKGVEKFCFSDDEDNDFNFKYVPTDQFKHILKDVRRQRSHKNDEKLWTTFQDQRATSNHLKPLKHPLRPNLSDINLELQSFSPEVIPQTHRVSKSPRTIKKTQFPKSQEPEIFSRRSSITFLPQDDDDDDDVSTLERSPVSKLDVKSKHSSSESTIRSSTQRKHRLLRKLNRLECNSSPDLSSQYESGEDDEFLELQPHPLIAQKILSLQGRISELLDEISYRLCRIPRPDGENDLKRRQKRVAEFSIRFSRNYLYEIGRQVGDIQKHLKAVLGENKGRRRGAVLHMQALEQKLCSSHQLLVCALNAYCNHIPSSVLQGHPGKLKEILGIVVNLRDVCVKINLTAEGVGGGDTGEQGLGNDLQSKCYALLSKVRLHSDNESQIFSARQSVVTGPFPSSNMKRGNSRVDALKTFTNRFSMYSIDSKYPKTQRQRRPVTVGVYPKDRDILRRSLNNPPPTPEQIYGNSIGQKSSKQSTRRKSRIHGVHGDEIRTMMDMIPNEFVRNSRVDLENVDNFGVMNQRGSSCVSRKFNSVTSNESKISIKRRAKQYLERNSNTSVKTSKTSINGINKEEQNMDERLVNLVPVIADLMSMVANKQNNGKNKSESASMASLLEIIKNFQQSDNHAMKTQVNNRVPNLKSTQPRNGLNNMQLIFLSQENDESPSKNMDTSRQASQDDSRLLESKDCRVTELMVSEKSAQKLLTYRDEYNASSRSNPMYESNSPNKPWEVVAWIADKLVDELIVDVSKELQMDEVIKKLFELEFLEF